jgi:hypothetical protein
MSGNNQVANAQPNNQEQAQKNPSFFMRTFHVLGYDVPYWVVLVLVVLVVYVLYTHGYLNGVLEVQHLKVANGESNILKDVGSDIRTPEAVKRIMNMRF